ncbi:MAG: 2OG-Fe(II) oxygenase [Pseudomonadota bacterium]
MSYLKSNDADPFIFEINDVREAGRDLCGAYRDADPFPHVVIDNFLPQPQIEACIKAFPTEAMSARQSRDRNQEKNKHGYHPDSLPPKLRKLFYTFNARPFITVVENITNIKGLIPDPHFLGGGFHEIGQGGHLSVHADFNHHKPLNLERRVNVLIYLNEDWREEFGGQLELWREDMSSAAKSITPILNRCVVFATTAHSLHGHPTPVAHPNGVTRKSIALYYYTATWDSAAVSKTTQFRPRPETGDRVDWAMKARELAEDLTPPIIMRRLTALARRTS